MDKILDFLKTDNGKLVIGIVGVLFALLVLRVITPKNININVYGAGDKKGVKHLWSSGKP